MFCPGNSYALAPRPIFVMAGLDPAIHVPVHAPAAPAEGDARIKSGHDEVRKRGGRDDAPNSLRGNFGVRAIVGMSHA